MKHDLFPIAVIIFRFFISAASAEEWDFLVMTDWHRGEVFATDTNRNSNDYKTRLDTLSYIHDRYGGELVVMPGDVATGKWHRPEYISKYFPGLSRADAVLKAGENCFGTIRKLFAESGWSKILVAAGDHEYGDNYWEPHGDKTKSLPQFRKAFGKSFYLNEKGEFKYNNRIGSAEATPRGTVFENTSVAHQHKNVLFVSVDVFTTVATDLEYFDLSSSSGGEGVVTGTVNGSHLRWLENVLKEGRSDPSIDYIVVQAHLPVLVPTRKVSSSTMSFDGGADSAFWKLLVKYGVTAYLAGEVHTITATKNKNSNLVQIISRSNFNNGFLKFSVTDTGINIDAYGEQGSLGRDNRNYKQIGTMQLPKHSTGTISSEGALELVDLNRPLIYFSFDESEILRSRPIDGMGTKNALTVNQIDIRGVNCWSSIPNQGEFGQQYDAQFGNVDLHVGVIGKSALFSPNSRMAIYSMGPFTGGTAISYSFWIKTKETTDEMILLHYAPRWNLNQGGVKNIFSMTLKGGRPKLYTSQTSSLTAGGETLNDGKWHNIAVIMPYESCPLSNVKIYVDGDQKTTSVTNDRRLYIVPYGNLGFGGLGYANPEEINFPNWKPYVGKIDEFYLWARPVQIWEVAAIQKKEFVVSQGKRCRQNKQRNDFVMSETPAKWSCAVNCKQEIACLGYEVKQKKNGSYRCVRFYNRPPPLGKIVTKNGHKPDCALLP